jgi:hypothetical protein
MPILSDAEIAGILAEPKLFPPRFEDKLVMKAKRGHKESELAIACDSGNRFVVIMRQSSLNPLDFSVILAVDLPGTNQRVILIRHNGKLHEHKNRIEGTLVRGFHIHKMTERYQLRGLDEDGYAEETTAYHDFSSARDLMFSNYGFHCPGRTASLFSQENDQ